MAVKGQATLDAANERRKGKTANPVTPEKSDDTTVAVMDPASGYEKPKTLRALEHIVESNAVKGAGYWRKAAEALLAIKTHKLWRNAVDADGKPYGSFALYAEGRFGFKKTYAYDLAKAAQTKPEALTEGEARAERKAARGTKPLTPTEAVARMMTAWNRWEDAAGDLRDRAIDHTDFVGAYDEVARVIGGTVRGFIERWTAIEGEATDLSADAEPTDLPLDADVPHGTDADV